MFSAISQKELQKKNTTYNTAYNRCIFLDPICTSNASDEPSDNVRSSFPPNLSLESYDVMVSYEARNEENDSFLFEKHIEVPFCSYKLIFGWNLLWLTLLLENASDILARNFAHR